MHIQPRKQKQQILRRVVVTVCVVVFVGAGVFVVWNNSNRHGQAIVPTTGGVPAKHIQANEGTDTTPLPKSTLADYKVAADLPRAIYIGKIGVAARMLPMGVNADNSMQAPININDAGWYTGSAKSGNPGAVVVDGHASKTGTNYGLFGNLNKLSIGDTITVERGDGARFTYRVVHTEDVPEDQVDMNKVMVPYGGATQGINLITCAGEWTKDGSTLDHRFIVYATLTS